MRWHTHSPLFPILGCCQERIPIQHGMARHSGDEDGKHWSTSNRRRIGLDRGVVWGQLGPLGHSITETQVWGVVDVMAGFSETDTKPTAAAELRLACKPSSTSVLRRVWDFISSGKARTEWRMQRSRNLLVTLRPRPFRFRRKLFLLWKRHSRRHGDIVPAAGKQQPSSHGVAFRGTWQMGIVRKAV